MYSPFKSMEDLPELQFPWGYSLRRLFMCSKIYYNIRGATLGPAQEISNISVSKIAS